MDITEELKIAVWAKGEIVDGFLPEKVRKDACGAWIVYDHFGNASSDFGWEIDHVCPQSILRARGVADERIDCVENLRPMQWQNNRSKKNDYPSYQAAVTADGEYNVERPSERIVNPDLQERLKVIYGM